MIVPLLVLLLVLTRSNLVLAQVGINTTDPKTTLQVAGKPTTTSIADGIQGPALTLAELDAKIASYDADQDGAIVYVNDVSAGSTTAATINITTSGYYYYDALNDLWKGMMGGRKTYSVGDFAQGGIVFWVDETEQHGLVVAKEDQSIGIEWSLNGISNPLGALGDGIYAGEANTTIIIAAQELSIYDAMNSYAARLCNELQITEGGVTYGDWYLPSMEELNIMYSIRAIIEATATANGGTNFGVGRYWSSTERFINPKDIAARYKNFISGNSSWQYKGAEYFVRAVRAF